MYARYVPPPKAKTIQPAAPPPPRKPEPPVAPAAPSFSVNSATPYARYIPPPKKPSTASTITPGVSAPPRKILFSDEDTASADTINSKSHPTEDGENDGSERKRKRVKVDAEAPEQTDEPLKEGKSRKKSTSTAVEEQSSTKANKKEKKKKSHKSEDVDLPDIPVDEPLMLDRSTAESNDKPGAACDSSHAVDKKKKKQKKKRSKGMDVAEKDADVEMNDAGDDSQDDDEDVEARHKNLLKKKEKSLRKASEARVEADRLSPGVSDEPLEQLAPESVDAHGLEPLPQPPPAVLATAELTYDTLPGWLANPIVVSTDTKAPWTSLGVKPELGITPAIASSLASRGYNEAFAVQTAVIPKLLPSPQRQADLVISAATGSGKTLSYVLPMVCDISLGAVTKLQALIVVPTRELVRQVQEVCEVCTVAFARPNRKRVKVGTSVGNQTFKKEQESLMEEELRYDPQGYRRLVDERTFDNLRRRDIEDLDFDMYDLLERPLPLAEHVVEHVSKVDILICTPGRLVEHIEHTPGFSLDYVRWLVVDEADKLLEQGFQGWLDIVMEQLAVEKAGARDFPLQNKSGVRKVILSATMTRNVSLLSKLKLRRPEMIVLEGAKPSGRASDDREACTEAPSYSLALPELLRESAIKIRDPSQKPLYLIDLLNSQHLRSGSGASGHGTRKKIGQDAGGEDSDTSEDSDDSDASSLDSNSDSLSSASSSASSSFRGGSTMDTALIFTKSNETALRLSRLLEILSPKLSSLIGTLTSTTRTSERKKVLRAFHSGKTRVLVASDLVARGLDLPSLDHVVNYDMPPSVRAYVHRVGRTARAGKAGHAWTFFTKSEAGWFFAEIAGQGGKRSGGGGTSRVTSSTTSTPSASDRPPIRRSTKVETVRVTSRRSAEDMETGGPGDFGAERITEYERALEALGKETHELRAK